MSHDSHSESSFKKPSLTQPSFQAQRNLRNLNTNSVSNLTSPSSENVFPLPTISHGTLSGMRSSKRSSEVSFAIDHYYSPHPHFKLENTYRLGPNDSQKFNVCKTQKLVNEILENHLSNFKYEPNRAKELTKSLSDEIKTRLKSIVYKRYKIVVNMTIGQKMSQDITMASRSLWNTDTDTNCTVEYENNSLYAIAIVFATYYE